MNDKQNVKSFEKRLDRQRRNRGLVRGVNLGEMFGIDLEPATPPPKPENAAPLPKVPPNRLRVCKACGKAKPKATFNGRTCGTCAKRAQAMRRAADGRCRCGSLCEPGRKLCKRHLDAHARSQRKRSGALRNAGVCNCGRPIGEGGTKSMCAYCCDRQAAYRRKWIDSNPEKNRESQRRWREEHRGYKRQKQSELVASGRCAQCTKPRGTNGTNTMCWSCADKRRRLARARRASAAKRSAQGTAQP